MHCAALHIVLLLYCTIYTMIHVLYCNDGWSRQAFHGGWVCHAFNVQEEVVQEQPQQEYAVDQWIIEFANLFREHTGESHVLWHAYLTNFPVSALHQHYLTH